MKVYIACSMLAKSDAREWAGALRVAGLTVSSSWHESTDEFIGEPSELDERRKILDANVAELEASDVVLALMGRGTPRATIGEIAYALGRGTPVVWLAGTANQNANIWDAHRLVHHTRSSSNALELLRRMARVQR